MRCVLFFALFLPLDSHYSIASGKKEFVRLQEKNSSGERRLREEEASYFGLASVAFIVQIVALYFFGSLLKSGSEWSDNTAAYYALSFKFLRTPLGSIVLLFPRIMALATFLIRRIEFWVPLLFFSPLRRQKLKLFAALTLMGLHMGLVMCLRIGVLFWAPCLALIAMLPAIFWDWLAARYSKNEQGGLLLFVDLKNWFSTRVLFVFYTFFLTESSASVQVAHLTSGRNPHEDTWLVVQPAGAVKPLKGMPAFCELCRASFFPPLWWLAWLVGNLAPSALESVFLVFACIEDNPSPFALSTVSSSSSSPSLPMPSIRQDMDHVEPVKLMWRTLRIIVLSLCLLFVLRHNVASLGSSPPGAFWTAIGTYSGLTQRWEIFSRPPHSYYWYKIKGLSWSGRDLSMLENGIGHWQMRLWDGFEEPKHFAAHIGSHRTLKYFETALNANFLTAREDFGKFVCRRWNYYNPGSEKAMNFEMLFVSQAVDLDANGRKPAHGTPLSMMKIVCIEKKTFPTSTAPTVAPNNGGVKALHTIGGVPGVPVGNFVAPPFVPPPKSMRNANLARLSRVMKNGDSSRASGGVGEMIDRRPPWENIIVAGGSSAEFPDDYDGVSLHSLQEKWSKSGLDAGKDQLGAAEPPTPLNVTKMGRGKWINGKWVVEGLEEAVPERVTTSKVENVDLTTTTLSTTTSSPVSANIVNDEDAAKSPP